MKVSAIIASGRPDISPCLESLYRQEGDVDFEIIVVHDESNRPSTTTDRARYIECNTSNPAVKRNMGAAAATGEILAFIDDDATAPPDWLKKGLAIGEKNPYTAGWGGPNLAPEDCSPAEKLTDAILSTRLGSGSGTYRAGGVEHDAKTGELHLVNLFLRRSVFVIAGGFNEALGYGAEDSEFIYLCKRMANATFIYDPNLFVYHSRRPFGPSFFRQRFKLRRQNGRLLWLRPGMYIGVKVGVAMFASLFLAMLAPLFPIVIPAAVIAYSIALAIAAFKVSGVGKIKWLLGVAALHFLSALGLMTGFIVPPSGNRYGRLLRRPA